MDKKLAEKIIIATTTYYTDSESDKNKANLTKETIKKSKELGFEIIILDGGSSELLIEEFESLGVHCYLNGCY